MGNNHSINNILVHQLKEACEKNNVSQITFENFLKLFNEQEWRRTR